jgi:formate-dependent nitrite reductase membrane component NrfD
MPAQPLSAAGVVPALALGGYTGVLLGTTSVPVWSTSPLLGGLFMASSLATGAAAVSLACTGSDDGSIGEALAPLNAVLGVADLALLGSYVATSGVARKTLLRDKARLLLAGATAAAATGITLEVASLTGAGNRRLLSAVAAGATLLGGALLRSAVVSAGHDSARDREQTLEATRPTTTAPGWQQAFSQP